MSTLLDERLLDLLLHWEEARHQGRDIEAEYLCSDCPELAAELDRRMRQLLAMEALHEKREALGTPNAAVYAESRVALKPVANGDNSSILRYRHLRLHASGGLGEIYVAHDEELNREVALKEIREPLVHDLNSRARFLLEAEVTGNLE